jgi:hypothetical protein
LRAIDLIEVLRWEGLAKLDYMRKGNGMSKSILNNSSLTVAHEPLYFALLDQVLEESDRVIIPLIEG